MSPKIQLSDIISHRVAWGPIGETVFKRTYSRLKNADAVYDAWKNGLPEPKKDFETWPETVIRVVEGNLGLVNERFVEADEREKLIGLMLDFGILPAGRHLNASGVKGRQFLFNCHAAGWDANDPAAHFGFMFDQLMQGGGVGSNYSNRYLSTMPVINRSVDLHIICREDHPNRKDFETLLSKHNSGEKNKVGKVAMTPITMVVEDSREGWVSTLRSILELVYAPTVADECKEVTITVDVSQIRAKGALLKTSGGIACGPAPLVVMLSDFIHFMNGLVGKALTSLDAMTLDHMIAACVVAGGKRRSSRMSVKNWKDVDILEFINCKSKEGAHWTTNISVEIDDEFLAAYNAFGTDRDDGVLSLHARQVMRAVILGKRLNGEPGLWNRSLSQIGERDPELVFCPNPCGEIALYMWENCNLGQVNLEYFVKRPAAELKEAFRLMTRFLIRATFADIPNPRQRKVVDQNRRIGVGFMGFHGWTAMRGIKYSDSWKDEFVRSSMSSWREVVKAEAAGYATEMGIPVPVKNTALAPNGTLAQLPGVESNIQAMFAKWFNRLVRYYDEDPELKVKMSEGYECWSDKDAKNTVIVKYWCEAPLTARVRAAGWNVDDVLESQFEIKFDDALEVQAMAQELFADNAVSYTINMTEKQLPPEDEMEATLIKMLPRIKGTTVFVDRSRYDAPFQPLTKEQFDSYKGQKEVTTVEIECKGGCPVK